MAPIHEENSNIYYEIWTPIICCWIISFLAWNCDQGIIFCLIFFWIDGRDHQSMANRSILLKQVNLLGLYFLYQIHNLDLLKQHQEKTDHKQCYLNWTHFIGMCKSKSKLIQISIPHRIKRRFWSLITNFNHNKIEFKPQTWDKDSDL